MHLAKGKTFAKELLHLLYCPYLRNFAAVLSEKKSIYSLVVLSILFSGTYETATGQVSIWAENFTYPNGTTGGQGTPAIALWTASGVSGGLGIDVQSNQLRGRNTTGPAPDLTTWYISVANPIEISGYTNVSITINISESGDFEDSDYIRSQYSLDGGAWTNFATNGNIINDFGTATASQTGLLGNSLRIQIIMYNSSDSEYHYADNILVTGVCTPLQPGLITGNNAPCQGTSQTYSVVNVPGVSYAWTVPAGWTITAGQTTNSITVTVGILTGNIQVTPSNACGNGPARTLAVTTTTIPSQPSSITGPASPCSGSSQTYSVINVAGTTYTWSFPADWSITAGQGTNSVTVTAGTTTGTASVTPVNACGTGTARTLAVTTITVPVQPGAITGPVSPCHGTSQNYTVPNTPGITYTWSFPADWSITAGQGTNSVTVTTGSLTGTASVTPSNTCGNGPAQFMAVTPLTVPVQPDPINGNSTPCQNSTQLYSVTNVAGIVYTWTVPVGWTITAGQTTSIVTVTTGLASGSVSVTPTGVCGDGIPRALAVTVQTLPAQPGAITPVTTSVCRNSTHNFMVLPPPPSGVTFTWAFPGGTVLSGQGTNVVQIRFGNVSGNLTVTPTNLCGTGPAQTMAITVIISSPALPGIITGIAAPCIGTERNYFVPNIAGIIYTWSVPAGWSIISGQGSNAITATVGATAGNISVIAGNACGGSSPRILSVSPQASMPSQPGLINGNSPVCQASAQTYSVSEVAFVVYNWVVPAGWTITGGNGTNSISVLAGAISGAIVVTPSNDCGTGTVQSRQIVVDISIPGPTSAINGNANPCETSVQVYSITSVSGISYNWTFPAGWNITAGQGSGSVTVTTGSISGTITVVPSNGCGNGPASTLPVSVFLLPVSAGNITGDNLFCEGTAHTYSVVNTPGENYVWSVPAGWTINSGQGTYSIQITAGVNSGTVQVIPQNACGNGPGSSLAVTVNPLPAADAGTDGAICVGATIRIGAPAVPGNTYLWESVPAGFTSTASDPEVSPDENTTFTLTETVTATGCANSNSIFIMANQIITVTAIPPNQTICTGETTSVQLSSNISGTIFTWEAYLNTGTGTTGFSDGMGFLVDQTITNVSGLPAIVVYTITASADECSNDETKINVTVNPAPAVNNQAPTAICSDALSGVVLGSSTNGVVVASYQIISINSNGMTTSAGNPVTGSGFTANEIANDAWTNTMLSTVNVVYSVKGVSAAGCPGNTFTVTLPVNPEPVVTNNPANAICSGFSTSISLTASIASTFSWTIGTITGSITGATAGSGNTISQLLINPDNATAGTVEYIVTPTSSSGSCAGSALTITVTVFPRPIVTNAPDARICSGSDTNLPLTSSTPSAFSWTVGAITGGITGALPGSGASINQVLVNPDDATSGTVQYIVTAVSISGGCISSPFTITITVDPIPAVTAGANPMSVCPDDPFDLTSSSSLTFAPTTLLSENFNGSTNGWTRINNSTGGVTPANAAWTLRASGYTYGGQTFISNDNTQFYLSNSSAQGSGNTPRTHTYLKSPVIDASGYISLSLEFYHYYFHDNNGHGYVQVSTNGTTWTNVADYTSTQGAANNFSFRTIDLSSYAGSPNLYIQFYFYAREGFYWAMDNVALRGTSSSTIPVVSWTSTPSGFTSSDPNPTGLTLAETTIFTVSYTNPLSGCAGDASVTVTSLEPPNAAIIADYCAVPGYIQLTATGGGTYLWSTGQTDPVILVDIAGQYSVTVFGTNGCIATAALGVSTELVVNGDFTSGNTNFTSGYAYDPNPNGLYAPESEYAVYHDAWYTHSNFWGYDHTSNSGLTPDNFMVVNGAKYAPQPTVWQQTVSVVPNTDYYYSAWAISLNNVAPFAKLRFEVNSVQVGTTATLTSGINSSLNPWLPKDRFYGSWNSGAATTAVIRIIDLETAAGGNDFGLDDISFGTLSPIPFTFSPWAQGGANLVCEGATLQLNVNITGGMAPYNVHWTGPNGFDSNLENPAIPNVSLAAQGIYGVTVYDSYGCTPQSDEIFVTINPAPEATVSGGGNFCQFAGSPFIWFTGSSGTPPYTFVYQINGGTAQTITTTGTDNAVFIFAPTNVTGTFTYLVTSVTDANGCYGTSASSTTVIINSLPSAYITGDWVVCPGSYNLYSGNSGMSLYEWSIGGNGSIPGATNIQNITASAGNLCGGTFGLTLMVTDNNGCNATAEETILVQDTEVPQVTGGIPLTYVEGCTLADLPAATATIAALEALGPAVTDNCAADADLLVTNSDGAPSGVCPMALIRTYTITDPCGNSRNITQLFHIDDSVPPAFISCPDNVTVQADVNESYATVTLPAPVYSDNCTIPANITLTWQMTAPTAGSGTGVISSPALFNVGTTAITYTISDTCDNQTVCQFTVTVIANEPPDISCAADVSINADAGLCSALINPQEPTVNAGSPVTWSWAMTGATTAGPGSGAINDYTFNTGVTTITWTATNGSGTDVCLQTITVIDNEPPVFNLPVLASGYCVEGFSSAIYHPGGAYYVDDLAPDRRDYYILTTGNILLNLTGIADNCPGTISIAWILDFGNNGSTDLSGTGQVSVYTPIDFPLGDNLIRWTVTDASGNSSTGSLVLTVIPRPDIID